jgi:hypothetical protein
VTAVLNKWVSLKGGKIPSILSFAFMAVETGGKTPLEAFGASAGWWSFKNHPSLTSQATDDKNQMKHERLSLTLLVQENMTPRTS